MKNLLIKFIDTFYFLFQRFIPLKTYRYAVCGGSNLVLDMVLYYVFYHYVFQKQDVNLLIVVLSSHIAALIFVYPITLTTGFLLNKYITFPDSKLPGKVQFFRYFIVGMGAMVISYIVMKFLVDLLGFYPTPSKFVAVMITIVYSYILQSKFSFKVAE